MDRIVNISELHPGDKIVRVCGFDGRVEILEYVGPHPHHESYSVFLNSTYDGVPKFYNERLQKEEWYRYGGDCWDEIHSLEIKWHERRIADLKKRMNHGA